AAGGITPLLFAGLLQLGSPPRRSDTYAPNVSYGDRSSSWQSPTPRDRKPSPEDRPFDRRAVDAASTAAAREVWEDQEWEPYSTPQSERQSRQTIARSATAAASTPADSWENRQPLNLNSWEAWGTNRSPVFSEAQSSEYARRSAEPSAYRPPADYVPPVVDAEVVPPDLPYADAEEDAYYVEDEVDAREYDAKYGRDRSENYSDDEYPYSDDDGDRPEDYSNDYSDRYSERLEDETQEHYRPSADDYDDYDDYASRYEEGDSPEEDIPAVPPYREPGTIFEWPVQPDEESPDEAESETGDVWESWSDSTSQAGSDRPPTESEPESDIWDDWDDEPSTESSASDDASPSRKSITEVQRQPVVQKQSGTVYSYTYRNTEDADSVAEASTEQDADRTTENRVLITPPSPSTEGSEPPSGD
ncbi:MAG: hypothetical protein IGR76_00125, partial [Synechococcales cyanobacterium T60_A2020_003]|nr:hypothetical protein [Synechococcales cyanobacterium T60_A2020_003]